MKLDIEDIEPGNWNIVIVDRLGNTRTFVIDNGSPSANALDTKTTSVKDIKIYSIAFNIPD